MYGERERERDNAFQVLRLILIIYEQCNDSVRSPCTADVSGFVVGQAILL